MTYDTQTKMSHEDGDWNLASAAVSVIVAIAISLLCEWAL